MQPAVPSYMKVGGFLKHIAVSVVRIQELYQANEGFAIA